MELEEQIGIEGLFERLGLKQITRNGSNIYSTCPFHDGADNPTGFSYNTKKGFGYCFTKCHRSYDIFDIVMKTKNSTFPESISYLADLVGVDIDYKFKINKLKDNYDNLDFLKQVRKTNKQSFDVGIEPFDNSVLSTFISRLHTVLRQEGFDDNVRDYFNLGFCTSGYLENRITIPIDSIDGDIVTISGRSILSPIDLEMMNIPKYKIYHSTDKSKTLYNISRALHYIKVSGEVIVVEGFKSVWRLHQWGVKNAVAAMGSTISNQQILLLLRLGVKIIVCGDRDEAGEKLNNEVVEKVKRYSDVAVIDMYKLNVPLKSSISDINKKQYEYLYRSKKEVV